MGSYSFPDQGSLNEKWDADFAYTRFFETKFKSLTVRPFSVFSYLNTLYSMPGKVGFKLMYKQLGLYPEILAYFIRHRIQCYPSCSPKSPGCYALVRCQGENRPGTSVGWAICT